MKKYLRTGMKLSRETREAWETAGFERVPFFAVGSAASPMWGQQLEADSLILNYGCSKALYAHDGLVLNQPSLIHRTRVEELPKYVGEYMPILRLGQECIVKANGSKGKGKLVVAEGSDVIVQRFLYPAEEFRVITWDIPGVMHPEVLAWSRKVIDDPMNPASAKEFQYLPTYEIPATLQHMLLVAHEKLGLNFVGWDVLLHDGAIRRPHSPDTGPEWWIIEANSAPGVGFETAKRIRKRLRRVLAPAVAA